MRKPAGLVLENNDGKVIRFLSTENDKVAVAINKNTARLHLVDAESLKNNKEEYEILHEIKAADVSKKPVKISDQLTLKAYETNMSLKGEIQPKEEDEDKFPIFMKYSAIGHVASVAFVILLSFIINKYFNSDNEQVVVQVFQQKPEFQKREIVKASNKRVTKKVVKKARVSNKTRVAKTTTNARNKSNRNVRQAAQNVNNMGALGVLGGFSKKMNGSGGLNVNAAKNNAGSGYGGQAAKGGHSRGLVGKGLVASGIGNGGDIKGYGGYGTSGKGGGQPGYGNRKIVGSSSGAMYALSDEALIEGGLDMDQINAVVKRNEGQLRQCYERALQQNPKIAGTVNIKFVISGAGNVSTARVGRNSLNTRNVESCILQNLRGWRFPKPVGNVSVRVDYPFVFARNG